MRVLVAVLVGGLGLTSCTSVSPEGVGADASAAPVCAEADVRCGESSTTVETCQNGAWIQSAQCGTDQICVDGACEACPNISFSVQTTQSCALGLSAGTEVDAESFINVDGQDHRVMAMDRWGAGHIMAWCDSSSLGDLLNAFDVFGYLGQVDAPRVASFGNQPMCDPLTPPDCSCTGLPTTIQYLGTELPAQYQGNPEALAADWDVVMFCGFKTTWQYDWSSEIQSFVADYGKGFAAIGEYDTYASDQDFVNMTKISSQAGILFEKINLDWASTNTDVVLECVPDVPPVQ